MKRFWFQFSVWISVGASLVGFLMAAPSRTPVHAQAVTTNVVGGPSPFITVTYIEPINVRSGPSTVFYPIIGQLAVGATAPALGTDPSHTWIEISYPSVPGGIGWIYATNVTLTGTLQIVEPPPTATPLATATIDPTLAAAFNIQPTTTRLPTFTPPASTLAVPTFSNRAASGSSGFPMAMVIFVVAICGVLVFVVSLFVRR
jgi:uncharacterized protein YraI